MSRRAKIRMTEDEIRKFLLDSKTMILCSVGKDGRPHPMPMWYGLEDDGTVVMTTFTKSQKIRNLERDPRVSLLVEAGESYGELRGVVVYGDAELVGDTDGVIDILQRVTSRSGATQGADAAQLREALRATAVKRTGIRVAPKEIVSWDHAKLGGAY